MIKICPICGGLLESRGQDVYKCKNCSTEGSFEELQNAIETLTGTIHSSEAIDADAGVTVFEKNKNAVMELSVVAGIDKSGTGFLLTDTGYALTNTHVVTNRETYQVASSIRAKIAGESVKATVVKLGDDCGGVGHGVDLALIRLESVPKKATTVTFGDYSKLRVGERIYPIGNAQGKGLSITAGIINDLARVIHARTPYALMTDAAINPGNSGGPVFDTHGNLIGAVVASYLDKEKRIDGMHYVIPLPIVKDFLKTTGVSV